MQEHRRSLLFRRQYTDLGALTERAIEINGSRLGFNGAPPPKLRVGKRLIEFGAAARPGDERTWQGQPHDLLGIDEAVQLLEAQVRFLMGWVRSTVEGQRTRTVLASNPPVDANGQWIIPMFRPWLDPTHHNPAEPGALRWFVTDPDGKDLEVDGPDDARDWDGQVYTPKSRTFIPASVDDNPYLVRTGYKATLDALPEPLRSAVRDGNFMAARKDDANQIIPTAWVHAAQARGKDIPMDAIGAHSAGVVVAHRRDGAAVVLDMGGGYGGPTYERLTDNGVAVVPYKGAEGSTARTADKKLGFVNKRSEALWRFREALDPSQEGGSPIALPDDPALVADLTAPVFEVTPRGIKAESKDDVVKRLGRSPDRGDAVIMAWTTGNTIANVKGGWPRRGTPPNVVVSHPNKRRQ